MLEHKKHTRFTALAVAAAAAVGYGTYAATTETSTPPTANEETTTSNATATSTEAQRLVDEWARQGGGGISVALAGRDQELTIAAAGSAGPAGGTVGPASEFRVGSLTKTFVAVMLLQLAADGTIGLDDPVVAHAADLTIAEGVTIRQLLAHRSGLPEHTDLELAPEVIAEPGRSWTATEVLDLVADRPRDFPPGAEFAYSNIVMRAVSLARYSGAGFAPAAVFLLLVGLQVGAIIAVPGLLISAVPQLFAAEASNSIELNARSIGTSAEVTCSGTPPLFIGQQYRCPAVNADGTTFVVTVSLQRANGWITWQVDDWGVYSLTE